MKRISRKSRHSKSAHRRSSRTRSRQPVKRLTNLQKCIIEFIDSHKQFLVALGTGSGKTLIAVMAAINYLQKYPKNRVIVITPAGLGTNFENELDQTGELNNKQKESIEYYTFESFSSISNPTAICKNAMVIIDEAHNLRTDSTKKFISVFKCTSVASKRLLLTATPFVNYESDVINLMSILMGHEVPDNIHRALKQLKNNVIFMKHKPDTHFPIATIKKIFVKMSPEYYSSYMRILEHSKSTDFKNASVFLHGYRKAVNSLSNEYTSAKIQAAIKVIKKDKTVIYSNWITYGQKPITQMLNKHKISYMVYDGSLSAHTRQDIIDAFNDDRFQVLIISAAGGTGINLKGVRKLIIVDPPWNAAILRQIEGRVARYNSHAHLPAEQRHVDIYEMILLTSDASQTNWRNDIESGDVMLYLMIEEKLKKEEAIYKQLKKMSIKC